MKKALRILINSILVIGWISIFISGFLAYFVYSFDEINNVPKDGLGSELTEAPFLARILLWESDTWAGLVWVVIDFIVFWGFVA